MINKNDNSFYRTINLFVKKNIQPNKLYFFQLNSNNLKIITSLRLYHYAGNNPINYVDPTGREGESIKTFFVSETIYGPYIYSESDNLLFIATFSSDRNKNNACTGVLDIYSPEQFDKNHNLNVVYTAPIASYPIVSGSDKDERVADGFYSNLEAISVMNSGNPVLRDSNHGGPSNTYIRIPDSGNRAIHQGHSGSNIEWAYTEGCISITALDSNFVVDNYDNFKTVTSGHKFNLYVRDISKYRGSAYMMGCPVYGGFYEK